MDSRNPSVVKKWTASYYMTEKRRWLYGTLSITSPNSIQFTTAEDGRNKGVKHDLTLRFDQFTEIKKASSTIVFSCIVIVTGSAQHWFSSLYNRDVVYNVLEHFWRERLIPSQSRQIRTSEKTKLGQDMIRIVRDSEKTLQSAAEQLSHQGKTTIHSQRILSIQSWLRKLKSPECNTKLPTE